MGWNCPRQSLIYEWRILYFTNRYTLAQFTFLSWKKDTVYQRFHRCRDKHIEEKLLELLVDKLDSEWLMINTSHYKVYSDRAGAKDAIKV